MCHGVQLLAIIPYGQMVVPEFWGEHPKVTPFLVTCKSIKGNPIIGMPKGRWIHQALL